MSNVPPHKRNVNTVFQQYALFPHMSIVDNVAFGLRAKKVPAREARRRALDMLDVVRLAEFADRRSTQLSGGQQQRVALARALVNMPAALLLDEPLAALDLKLREAMQLELKRIQREVGITFIFVTHDQGEALTMSDRIAVMSRGRVEQIGTPEEIYERPGEHLRRRLHRLGEPPAGRARGRRHRGADRRPRHRRPPRPAVGRRRPRRRSDHGDAPPGARSRSVRPTGASDGRSLPATVKDVIFQGSSLRLIADAPGDTELLVTVEIDDDTPDLRPGDEISLHWSPGCGVPAARPLGDHRGDDDRRRRGAGDDGRQGRRRGQGRRRPRAEGAPGSAAGPC